VNVVYCDISSNRALTGPTNADSPDEEAGEEASWPTIGPKEPINGWRARPGLLTATMLSERLDMPLIR
jgi:hypothetical protein